MTNISPSTISTRSTFSSSPQTAPNYLGYLLEEDQALKNKLQGIVVSDVNNNFRPVKVWFRLPEQELRTVTYPYMMIDFLGETVESDREHRGTITPYFWPYTNIPFDQSLNPPVVDFPIPMSLHYQVSTFTRSAQHDRQIISALHDPTRLHPRFGYLDCPGGTCRRMDIRGPMSGDIVDPDNKRVFRKIYQLTVSSEITPLIDMSHTRVRQVYLNVFPLS